jgi:hypothetical protein
MEIKNILSSQKEIVIGWKGDFREQITTEGEKCFTDCGNISAETYCALIGLDYRTVERLGEVTYSLDYHYNEGISVLYCSTFIDSVMNDKLSVGLEDTGDWLGLFNELGKAQWLPSNWKELITDEQLHDILRERNIQTIECLIDDDVPDEMKERIARDWCENNSDELKDFLTDDDREDIAYAYVESNPSDMADRAFGCMSSCDQRDFVKDCIDNL